MAARPDVLTVDASRLEDLINGLEDLSGSMREQLLPRVLNNIGKLAQTQVKRTIANEMGIAVNRVGAFLRLKQATPGHLAVTIRAKGPRLPLKDFKPKPAKVTRIRPPIGVSVIDRGTRKVLPHTFIGPNEHIFVRSPGKRVMSKGRYEGKMREPIRKMWGPGVPLQLLHGASRKAVETLVETDGARIVASQYDYITGRVKAKRKL